MVIIVALKVFGNSSVLSSLGWLLLIVFSLINGQCLLILCMFTHILDPFTCLRHGFHLHSHLVVRDGCCIYRHHTTIQIAGMRRGEVGQKMLFQRRSA